MRTKVSLVQRAAPVLMLLTLAVMASNAAAQSAEQVAPVSPVAPAARGEPPSLMPPVYYMLAPGAVLLGVGGIMYSQDDPTVDRPALVNASITLMLAGGTMMVGSVYFLGARIGKRRRWIAQRRWEACGPNCSLGEPKVLPGLSMLVPGALLMAVGSAVLVRNWTLESSEGSLPGDPELGYDFGYVIAAATSLALGTTLFIAGIVHMTARMQLRAAWQRRNGALSHVRVFPSLSMGPGAANYSAGLVLSAQF